MIYYDKWFLIETFRTNTKVKETILKIIVLKSKNLYFIEIIQKASFLELAFESLI